MKKLYEAPIIEFSEFEIEDVIMESVSLGEANLEHMEETEWQEYNAVMNALKKSYTVKRYGTDFTGGW